MEKSTTSIEYQDSRNGSDETVIRCAANLFLKKGIEGVKMVDIASEANIGVATLYRHFSTKNRIAVSAATLLWRRFNRQLMRLVESDRFLELNGMGRMQVLLHAYCDAYMAHGDFVSFLDEFDRLVLVGQLNRKDLKEYGAELDSFYGIFEGAYLLGREDGSILRELDFRPFYLAFAHALIGVAQKLRRGEIIPSDDFSSGRYELQSIVNMALWSLAGRESIPPFPANMHFEG